MFVLDDDERRQHPDPEAPGDRKAVVNIDAAELEDVVVRSSLQGVAR
jgi:hypothetical protein